jgi:putative transcriptional regulator
MTEDMDNNLRGQLLVASPTLVDPNFLRTVVLITEHTDDGAMGIVLNRPSTATVEEAAPELEPLVVPEEDVFIGGPVQPTAIVVVAEFERADDAGVPIFSTVGFVAAGSEPAAVEASSSRARVFAGFAGWAPGQLEGELERDDWFLEPARVADVFTPEPEDLWSTVLDRKGGEYALVARMPLDPTLN